MGECMVVNFRELTPRILRSRSTATRSAAASPHRGLQRNARRDWRPTSEIAEKTKIGGGFGSICRMVIMVKNLIFDHFQELIHCADNLHYVN